MGKRVAVLVALGVAVGLAPLAPANPAPTGGTFRVAEPAVEIDTIDAALAGTAGDGPWVSASCASLMHLRDRPLPAGFRIAPELAASFPRVTHGGTTYVFTIRRDARFNTGAPVTAADVAYSIDRVLNPTLKSPVAAGFQEVVGAQQVLDGKAAAAAGITASGRTLTITLTHPDGGFLEDAGTSICVVPAGTPADPAGLQAPIPSAAPYYVSQYVPSQQIVLERNPYYRGPRPQHIDRIVFDLTVDENGAVDDVLAGTADYAWVPNVSLAPEAPGLARRFGVNRSRFFVEPSVFVRMYVLNTSRPLLRNNLPLRQAINDAVDRTALRDLDGRYGGTTTDQFLPPIMPGYRNARVYPLRGPDLAKARALAKGHLRGGKLVLYVPLLRVAEGQLLVRELAQIGLHVQLESFPPILYFQKLATRTEPFDMAYIGWDFALPDPGAALQPLFDGSAIGTPANTDYSYFDSPPWNRALERALRLSGAARYRAFGRLDVLLARDAAPAVPISVDNSLTFVSARTGCVIVHPDLDLAAVCIR